jgi:hypothetical protein
VLFLTLINMKAYHAVIRELRNDGVTEGELIATAILSASSLLSHAIRDVAEALLAEPVGDDAEEDC